MGYYGYGWSGMMGNWSGWGWLMSLTILVWLLVGILAAIWLWKHIKK